MTWLTRRPLIGHIPGGPYLAPQHDHLALGLSHKQNSQDPPAHYFSSLSIGLSHRYVLRSL